MDPKIGMAMGEMVTAVGALNKPTSIAFDNQGNMYVGDDENRVLKWRKAHLRANSKGSGVSAGEIVAAIK